MVASAKPVLEPDSPEWFKRWQLRALAFWVPNIPTRPTKLFGTTTANRPAAADYPQSLMYDQTLNQVIYSDGTTWTAL